MNVVKIIKQRTQMTDRKEQINVLPKNYLRQKMQDFTCSRPVADSDRPVGHLEKIAIQGKGKAPDSKSETFQSKKVSSKTQVIQMLDKQINYAKKRALQVYKKIQKGCNSSNTETTEHPSSGTTNFVLCPTKYPFLNSII